MPACGSGGPGPGRRAYSATAASALPPAEGASLSVIAVPPGSAGSGQLPRPTIEDYQFAAVDEDALDLGRVAGLVEALYAEMEPGERIFYQRCTVCHGPRDPRGFTQLQWRGITPSMFPRAGLEEEEAKLVMDFLLRNASDAPAAN